MAVPKRKTSKSRRNKRRSHIHFDSKNVVKIKSQENIDFHIM